MNDLQKRLMDKPSIISDYCAFCYRRRTEYHHIVKRSQGGTDGPVVAVCGFGNTYGCHSLLERNMLHLDWDDDLGWVYMRTDSPKKDVWKCFGYKGWKEVKIYESIRQIP